MSNFPDNFSEQVQVYLVGGAVRDKLLGLPVKDHDYVVVGATPELMLQQGFKPVGKDFPVFLHPKTGEEYALARTERKVGQGYHGFSVFFAQTVTLEEDLFRRDLTINAMAENNHGQLIDPYDGQADIEQKVLRHVSSAFSEDPLRVLRLLRFHAKLAPLGFRIHEQTWRLAAQMVKDGELDYLTVERTWTEVVKALSSDAAEVFWQDLYELGALNVIGLANNLSSSTFHDMQNALRLVSKHSQSAEVRFAAWLEPYSVGAEQIAHQLPLPKHYQYWLALFANHAQTLRDWHNASAEAKWQAFKHSGSLRHDGDMIEFAQALGLSKHIVNDIAVRQLQLQAISPQSYIKNGLQGKAVGEAIKETQLALLAQKVNQI